MSVSLSLRRKTAELFMNSNYTQDEKELCIICFENSLKKYNYKIWSNYYKNCQCKFFVHQDCFNEWYKINPICPICRKVILSKDVNNVCKNFINKYCNITITYSKILIVMFLWFYFITTLIEVVYIY